MPTYDAQGVYRDEQGNVAPDPRTGDMAPAMSQAIADLFGTSYTPGRAWDPSMGGSDDYIGPTITHDPTALATGRSTGGTFMPRSVQIGSGAATPAKGIQSGTLEEDIDQEAGGVGNVWDNVMPALEGGGDPYTKADNIPRPVPPPEPIPPQAAQVPQAAVPDLSDVIYDDDRTSPHEYRLGERQQRRDLRQADPDYWGMGGAGDDSIIRSIMDLFRPDPITEVYDDDFTSGTAARAARREQEKAIDADNQAKSPIPAATETARQGAGANTVPPTGDDAGDLRGAKRPMTEGEYMENVVPQVPTRGTAPRVSPRPGGRDVRLPVQNQQPVPIDRQRMIDRILSQQPIQQQEPETVRQNALMNWIMNMIAGGNQRVAEYDTERNLTNIGP
jgi:hypothetical protein